MDISETHSELFSSLMALIRSSSSLYSLDVGFVRSFSREAAAQSEESSQQLLSMINKLMRSCNGGDSALDQPFRDANDIIQRWSSIEQTFDLLFDKIDAPQRNNAAKSSKRESSQEPSGKPVVQDYMKLTNNVAKPQLHFATKVDNSLRPFKPLLTQKPNASYLSLKQSLKQQAPDDEHPHEWYEQPYIREILESPYPAYDPSTALEMPDWDTTPITFVDTADALFKMTSKLERASEIAVDVEHHEYRSYLGLVCLLQISALGEDYVIDALALRSELQVLNRVFTNPNIVKVLHGARMDIAWLQRDLGLYIVNLFDTHFAARELGFPKHSLAYLLQHYAGFEASKKYQLADWRFRPLPQELVDYARADTHFLLYIYHQLRQKLDTVGKTDHILQESRKEAAFRYEYPGWNLTEPAWGKFAEKHRLNRKLERAILVKLFEWRDRWARELDESVRYIMAPNLLANLCVMKPTTEQGIRAAYAKRSDVVEKHMKEIIKLIKEASENPNAVDTTLPPRKHGASSGAGVGAAIVNGGDTSALTPDALRSLKLDTSPFIGPSQPITSSQRKPLIDLQVYEARDLKKAQAFNEKLAREQEEEERRRAEHEATEAEQQHKQNLAAQIEADRREAQRSEEADSGASGKRLNLVNDNDEFELSSSIIRPKARKTAQNEEAFDFKNAKSVLNDGDDDSNRKSYSRFGTTVGGPRGAHKNNSKFKKAKSFRR